VATKKHASNYPSGCAPPEGYIAWHAWAESQHKAGLRQRQCVSCGLWRFPQETCCGVLMSKQFSALVAMKSNGQWIVAIDGAEPRTLGPFDSEDGANTARDIAQTQHATKHPSAAQVARKLADHFMSTGQMGLQ
jgi:hypothetical protein